MFTDKVLSWLASPADVLGINGRNLELIYTHNPRRAFPNVDDKLRCKQLLTQAGLPTPVTYHAIVDSASMRRWPEQVAGVPRFVVKPNGGSGGNGIKLVERIDTDYQVSGKRWSERDLTFHMRQILNGAFSIDNLSDTCYLEETVANHADFGRLIPAGVAGVADIRLIFQQSRCIMGMCRLPTHASDGKANLHQGGIGVGIDLATGLTLQGVLRNDIIAHHPDTGEPLAGQPVPAFAEMCDWGSRVSEVVGLGYIGIDFVCDARRGPLILEVNARPGLNIQLANQAGLRGRLWG